MIPLITKLKIQFKDIRREEVDFPTLDPESKTAKNQISLYLVGWG